MLQQAEGLLAPHGERPLACHAGTLFPSFVFTSSYFHLIQSQGKRIILEHMGVSMLHFHVLCVTYVSQTGRAVQSSGCLTGRVKVLGSIPSVSSTVERAARLLGTLFDVCLHHDSTHEGRYGGRLSNIPSLKPVPSPGGRKLTRGSTDMNMGWRETSH